MNRKRVKIVIASLILAAAMAFLVVAGVKNTSMRHFAPDALVAHAQEVDNKPIQVDGLIAEGTTQWDPKKVSTHLRDTRSGRTSDCQRPLRKQTQTRQFQRWWGCLCSREI